MAADSNTIKFEKVWTWKQCIFLCQESCKYVAYNARRHLCLLSNASQILNPVQAYGWNSFQPICAESKFMCLIFSEVFSLYCRHARIINNKVSTDFFLFFNQKYYMYVSNTFTVHQEVSSVMKTLVIIGSFRPVKTSHQPSSPLSGK